MNAPIQSVDHQQLIKALDEAVDTVLDRLDRGYAPIWEGHNQIGRTVIGLSSGALVLSISVAQLLREQLSSPTSPWLLTAAWVLLVIAVAAEVYRQGRVGAVQSYRLVIELQRGSIRQRVLEFDASTDIGAELEELLTTAFNKADEEQRKWLGTYTAYQHVSSIAFVLGLIALAVFAIVNPPF